MTAAMEIAGPHGAGGRWRTRQGRALGSAEGANRAVSRRGSGGPADGTYEAGSRRRLANGGEAADSGGGPKRPAAALAGRKKPAALVGRKKPTMVGRNPRLQSGWVEVQPAGRQRPVRDWIGSKKTLQL